jgi:hypothetical protein
MQQEELASQLLVHADDTTAQLIDIPYFPISIFFNTFYKRENWIYSDMHFSPMQSGYYDIYYKVYLLKYSHGRHANVQVFASKNGKKIDQSVSTVTLIQANKVMPIEKRFTVFLKAFDSLHLKMESNLTVTLKPQENKSAELKIKKSEMPTLKELSMESLKKRTEIECKSMRELSGPPLPESLYEEFEEKYK